MGMFDQIWIENRFRYRKGMKGTAMRMDDETGYLESCTRRGFTARNKAVFIERFKVCKNRRQIAKSINIDIQAVYDAVALDVKFRKDFIACELLDMRSNQLNDKLVEMVTSEKQKLVIDLTKKLDSYNK